MGIVCEKLLSATHRPNVVNDCVKLIDAEVEAKSGVTGMLIKGGYKGFKAIKPSIVKEAVDHLLDEFVQVFDKHYEEYKGESQGGAVSFESWAVRRDERLADDLLGITDRKIAKAKVAVIRKIYEGMRKIAQRQVAMAIPAIARLLTKHVG
jgi:hypothetical protein